MGLAVPTAPLRGREWRGGCRLGGVGGGLAAGGPLSKGRGSNWALGGKGPVPAAGRAAAHTRQGAVGALLTRGCLARSNAAAVWFKASSAPQATASLARVKLCSVLAQGPWTTSPKAATNSSVRPCSGGDSCFGTGPRPRTHDDGRLQASHRSFQNISLKPRDPPAPPRPRHPALTGEGLGQQQEDSDPDLAREPHAQAKEGGQSEGAHQAAPGAVSFHQQLQEPIGRGQGQAQAKPPQAADHRPGRAGLRCPQGLHGVLCESGRGCSDPMSACIQEMPTRFCGSARVLEFFTTF